MKIFHHNDLDGYGSAAVIAYHRKATTDVELTEENFLCLEHHPQKDFEKIRTVKPGETAYFVDYSFSENTLPWLQMVMERTKDLIWIDHHQTSVDLMKLHPELEEIRGVRYVGISGAALSYMWINDFEINEQSLQEKVPYFLQLIDDHDCWKQKKTPVSDYFMLGMKASMRDLCGEYSIWNIIFSECMSPIQAGSIVTTTIAQGDAIKKYLDAFYAELREEYGYESELEGVPCFVVNTEGNSWVFGDLINKYPMVAIYTFDGEYYRVSLYSQGKVDCSKIAEKYGGGGHVSASGFSCTTFPFPKK